VPRDGEKWCRHRHHFFLACRHVRGDLFHQAIPLSRAGTTFSRPYGRDLSPAHNHAQSSPAPGRVSTARGKSKPSRKEGLGRLLLRARR
jgi:hypothetical protein